MIYPEKSSTIVNLVNVEPQIGPNDCGLFAIAYAKILSYGKDPYNYKLHQSTMWKTYNFFVNYGSLPDFEFTEISNKKKFKWNYCKFLALFFFFLLFLTCIISID